MWGIYMIMAQCNPSSNINHLNNNLVPFLVPEDFSINMAKYDLILIIDTPQIFQKISRCANVYIECHTPYIENRQYLIDIPNNIRGIIIPSKAFQSILQKEFPHLSPYFIFPNFVPEEFFQSSEDEEIFKQRPLTYLARLDDLKNFDEATNIFESVIERKDIMNIVIGKGATENSVISTFGKKNLLEKTILRDRISFGEVPQLINIVQQHSGVFISPSKGESFGLSAAEFICGGVPVLLSDIQAHRELVNNDDRFIYPLGEINLAKNKLTKILNNWDSASESVVAYGRKYTRELFIKKWLNFMDSQGLDFGARGS